MFSYPLQSPDGHCCLLSSLRHTTSLHLTLSLHLPFLHSPTPRQPPNIADVPIGRDDLSPSLHPSVDRHHGRDGANKIDLIAKPSSSSPCRTPMSPPRTSITAILDAIFVVEVSGNKVSTPTSWPSSRPRRRRRSRNGRRPETPPRAGPLHRQISSEFSTEAISASPSAASIVRR